MRSLHRSANRRQAVPSVQEFFQEVREVDRDNEVNRILGAFKLNPMEQLGLRFDASLDDIKRQYRSDSALSSSVPHSKQLAEDVLRAGKRRSWCTQTSASIPGLRTPSRCWATRTSSCRTRASSRS